ALLHAFPTRRSSDLIQRDAGASVVQLFDSWAGSLSPTDYRTHIAPHSHAALEEIGVPSIHFGVGTGQFLDDMRLGGIVDAVGVRSEEHTSELQSREN